MTTNEITIDVQGFRKVLDMVKGCVPSKTNLPILTDVKLDTTGRPKPSTSRHPTATSTSAWSVPSAPARTTTST